MQVLSFDTLSTPLWGLRRACCGVYCMAELKVPRKTQSFVVPADAISFNRNGMQVAVVSNGKAEIRTAVPAIRKSPEEAALPGWDGGIRTSTSRNQIC
jgi:hypothetical protein